MSKCILLIAVCAGLTAGAETVRLEPVRLNRIAWGINWTDEIRRIGGDAGFDGGPQRLVLSFDLGRLPEGFVPEKAELVLQSRDPVIDDGVLHLAVTPLERNLAQWDRETLSQPGVLPAAPYRTFDWSFSWEHPGRFDLSPLAAEWLSGERLNFGLLLSARDDLGDAPDRDMFAVSDLYLEVTGSGGEALPEPAPSAMAAAAAPGSSGWRFPDGSIVPRDGLPGSLISGNAGFWGNYQVAGGMASRLTADAYPADGSLSRDAKTIFDGDLAAGVVIPGAAADPILVMEFPEAATLREADLALRAASGTFEIALLAGETPETLVEFARFRQRAGEREFFRFGDFDPVTARCFGLANTGASPLELREVLLWGDAVRQPSLQATGILPEMASLARREMVLPWFDAPPSREELLALPRVDFTRLGSSDIDADTAAHLAMSPAGLDILWVCRDRDGASADRVELYINRYDLEERRYYVFSLDRDGVMKVDASAVIDPTKGETPFQPECSVSREDGLWVGHMRLPLAAMAGGEGFEVHRWPANLSRRVAVDGKESISAWPAVPELHIPMLFALLQSRRRADAAVDGFHSFTGIPETGFDHAAFARWRQELGPLAEAEVVAVPAPFDSEILSAPILPTDGLNRPRREAVTAAEVENLAWYVINPSPDRTARVRVEFSGFDAADGVEAELGAVGVVQRRRGAMLRPIFLESNFPGAMTLRQYVRNAAEIEDFPVLELPPGRAALVTLRVKTAAARPGLREGTLRFGSVAIPVQLEVLPLTAQRPEDYYYTVWARPTAPAAVIAAGDYAANEAEYWRESGYNVVHSYPISEDPGVAALEERIPDLKYIFNFSGKYTHIGYCGLLSGDEFSEENRREIIEEVRTHRDRLLAAGFDYGRWIVEMWDEPGTGVGTSLMAQIARTVKEFDPAILLYSNPCCWGGNGFVPDQEILDAFLAWYPEYIDVSLPIEGLYFGFAGRDMKALRQLWDRDYRYKGTYIHPCPGRMQLWRHFKAGLNAWGYYSYYAPRANPWNDFDTGEMDYETVYPGISAMVMTIESEQMREGFEDICLLTTLAARGRGEAVEEILATMDAVNLPWSFRRGLLLQALEPASADTPPPR